MVVYFLAVIGLTMFFSNPFCLVISLITSLIAIALLISPKTALKSAGFAIGAILLMGLVNPLFVHDGLTVLFFINDSPITLEAFLGGLSMGTMLVSSMLWFMSFSKCITSERIIYLFGRWLPSVGLLLSMTLRLIPKARKQLSQIRASQRAMGMDLDCGSPMTRIKNGMRILSALITWLLENGVDTADVMEAKGYGVTKRSSFHSYHFCFSDGIVAAVVLLLCILIIALRSGFSFSYYVGLPLEAVASSGIVSAAVFGFLAMIPIFVQVKEDLLWRYSKSKI